MAADDKALDFAGFQKPISGFVADTAEHFTHLLDIDYIGILGEQQFIGNLRFHRRSSLSFLRNQLVVVSFPLITVGAGVFFDLLRVDPAQRISTCAVEVIGAGAAKAEDQLFRHALDQTDADRQRMVDAADMLFGQMADEVAQTALIHGTQLF